MRIKQTVSAFTILEVTIAMLLASVSIAIAYTAFTVVSRSYKNYDAKNKALSELALADKLLKKDFAGAEEIIRSENGITLNSKEKQISYEFDTQYILRIQNGLRTDTFRLPVKNLFVGFQTIESTAGGLVDKLQFVTTVMSEDILISSSKTYSAEELIGDGLRKMKDQNTNIP